MVRRGVIGERQRPTVQLTTDPDAPIFGKLDPDDTHPYRLKELLEALRARLPGVETNQHDALCVRAVYDISPEAAPQFMVERKYGSPQYSDALVDWLVDQYGKDPDFFTRARARYRTRAGRSEDTDASA